MAKQKQYEYDRKKIHVNINKDMDRDFQRALDDYVAENGLPMSTALRTLARKQLIAEGKLKVISKHKN